MNTLFTGQVIIKLAQTESTNKFAAELIAGHQAFEGTVITCNHQTSGKGQRGKAWHSEEGKNLLLSVIFKPEFLAISSQFQLSKAIALAVADFIELQGLKEVSVKWPNDVYVNNRKIAGILIENLIKNDKISYSIVGIGININQNLFAEDIPNATSLKIATGIDYDLDDLLKALCGCLEQRYLSLRANTNAFDREYLERLYKFNCWSNYNTAEKAFEGKIIGISPEGKLLIETREEEIRAFEVKEVAFI